MGEMSDCFKSSEEIAIERIAKRRFEIQRDDVSNDFLDRQLYERIKKGVEDEFILFNGRKPQGSQTIFAESPHHERQRW